MRTVLVYEIIFIIRYSYSEIGYLQNILATVVFENVIENPIIHFAAIVHGRNAILLQQGGQCPIITRFS